MHANHRVHNGIVAELRRALAFAGRGLLPLGLMATVALTTQVASATDGSLIVVLRRPPGAPAMVASGVRPDRWGPEELTLVGAAAALRAREAGDLAALRRTGEATLAAGRNEATVEAFLHLRGTARLIDGLEHYGAMLASADAAQLAIGVAGLQRYSGLIHSALLHGRMGQLVVISLQGQALTAYDNATVVETTPVTTGRPALTTDVGLMHVLRKDSPWTMHSPWPKGSPLWYPDTQVAMVAWFTTTGEGMHDAAWEPASAFGPGSEDGPYASHGCVHLPLAAESVLFGWVQTGAPVVVVPADGTPVAEQLMQQSVDQLGNPISGARGA